MARPRESDLPVLRVGRGAGPVVRRSWLLRLDVEGPLLTGLFGFPWREQMVQAKCTRPGVPGRAELFGTTRIDRSHGFVPSPGCTCGIYATDEPDNGWLHRRYLHGRFVVNGFVRLSGRIVVHDPVYRAEVAEVLGPLTISLPAPGRFRRLAAPTGIHQTVRRVVEEGGGFGVRYTPGTTGVSVGEWHMQMARALMRRYGAATVGVFRPAGQ